MSEQENHGATLTAYLTAFINGLRSQGVKNVVISPGSRSTPLAMLFALVPDWQLHVQIDERAAAFYALGIAKRTKEAVVLLCTSGTAAANYFPALVEAKLSEIPLVVLTTDRPHELRDVGAPQTIDQIHLYGGHVKEFVEMALPEASEAMCSYAQWQAEKAVQSARRRPAAAVHLNFPFREPLIPDFATVAFAEKVEGSQVIRFEPETLSLADSNFMHQLAGKKGIFVVGASPNTSEFRELVALAQKWGWPLLADPLANLRTGRAASEMSGICAHYDSFLKVAELQKELVPEVVVRFGQMPVSKPLTKWLATLTQVEHYLVDPSAVRKDPIMRSTVFLEVEPALLIRSWLTCEGIAAPQSWLNRWLEVETQTAQIIHQALVEQEAIDEGRLILELEKHAPENALFFVSNSMPIRDFDSYLAPSTKTLTLYANRGANGIDGILATAQGMQSQGGKVYVIVGDVAFAHDLSSLLSARRDQLNLTILLINNHGGGIFSFLPQAAHPQNFELLFGTPLPLEAEKAAALFAADYKQPKNWHEFADAMLQSHTHRGLQLIEIQTERPENVERHRKIDQAVAEYLKKND